MPHTVLHTIIHVLIREGEGGLLGHIGSFGQVLISLDMEICSLALYIDNMTPQLS